jgi:segregation and condensation protein B
MEMIEVKKIIEAILFVSGKSVSVKELKNLLKDDYTNTENFEEILKELKQDYANSDKPYEIDFIADGWTFITKADYSPWIKKFLNERKPVKLSPSALEVLSIIAYKQNVTRGDVDEIRGVDSSWAIDTLVERRLIKIVGRRETLGRPLLYSTTQEFLKHFKLPNLSALPLIDNSILEIANERLQTAVQELPLYEDSTQTKDGEIGVGETATEAEVDAEVKVEGEITQMTETDVVETGTKQTQMQETETGIEIATPVIETETATETEVETVTETPEAQIEITKTQTPKIEISETETETETLEIETNPEPKKNKKNKKKHKK